MHHCSHAYICARRASQVHFRHSQACLSCFSCECWHSLIGQEEDESKGACACLKWVFDLVWGWTARNLIASSVVPMLQPSMTLDRNESAQTPTQCKATSFNCCCRSCCCCCCEKFPVHFVSTAALLAGTMMTTTTLNRPNISRDQSSVKWKEALASRYKDWMKETFARSADEGQQGTFWAVYRR